MKLSKALKEKKKLTKKIGVLAMRLRDVNSYDEKTTPAYDPAAVYAEYLDTIEKLVALKAAIHVANQPIMAKLFKMAETKGLIAILKSLPIREGKEKVMYAGAEPSVYKCFLNAKKRDEEVQVFEDLLETLQEEVEEHNATTTIKI